jgi:hypothetical protein
MRTRGGRGSRYVVTIGNEASLPATGFGYIGVGEPFGDPRRPECVMAPRHTDSLDRRGMSET